MADMGTKLESKDYKVLTKDEYDAIMAVRLKTSISPPPTPRPTGPRYTMTLGGRLPTRLMLSSPGPTPIPRLAQALNNTLGPNTSCIAQPYNAP